MKIKMIISILLSITCILIICSCSTPTVTYKTVYPTLAEISQPTILNTKYCNWEIITSGESRYVALDETNYKCYLYNKEVEREQRLLYKKMIDEINNERKQWKIMNEKNNIAK